MGGRKVKMANTQLMIISRVIKQDLNIHVSARTIRKHRCEVKMSISKKLLQNPIIKKNTCAEEVAVCQRAH